MLKSVLKRIVRVGSDQSIQHHRSHHPTKTKSSQLEWEMVRVMRYDVYYTNQIPRTRFIYRL